jgi:peptidoglycan-associated lipoprotein
MKVLQITRMAVLVGVASLALSACSKKTAPPPSMDTTTPPTQTGSSDPGSTTTDTGSQEIRPSELQDIFFEYDQSSLRSDARRVLDGNAEVLKASAGGVVTLEGHCDERGTVEYNIALGERRAREAKNYLVNLGVPDSQLRTISYGEERPFDPGHDEAAWSQNRRVHFQR